MRLAALLIAPLTLAACAADAPTGPRSSPPRVATPRTAVVTATVTDLGTLPGGTKSEAFGINDAGVVVGYSTAPNGSTSGYAERPFRWTAGGGMEELGFLSSEIGWDGGRANAINASGQIAGWTYAPTRWQRATLWTATGGPYDLGALTSAGNSLATAMNDVGQVVGGSASATGFHAFLWTPGTPNGTTGAMVDLGTLGGASSWATGINDAGTVVGYSPTSAGQTRAFLWTAGGGMVDLGTLGGTQSWAHAINAQGQIVGYATTADGPFHAFLWTPSAPGATTGTMIDLGVLVGWPLGDSRAYGINEQTVVVGGDNSSSDAWRWSAADDIQDLGPTTGGGREAYGINESGQVVGSLVPAGGSQRRATLWTVTIAPPTAGPLAVAIDVAPGEGTNTISLKASTDAVVAVAVLTTPTFDAPTLVDPATARLGTTPVAAKKKGGLYVSTKDVDLDGDADLVLHFERAQLVANGDLTTATSSLTLRATLTDGRAIEGQDEVRVIKK